MYANCNNIQYDEFHLRDRRNHFYSNDFSDVDATTYYYKI